jgi:formylglycine-generating enzyme required for sulfatase activity
VSRVSAFVVLFVAGICLSPAPGSAQYFCEIQGLEWVSIGDVNNAADTTGYGSVTYPYQISRYEITNAQYAAFLNAVATNDDPNALYDLHMEIDPPTNPIYISEAGGIHRTGTQAPYSYAAKPGFECRPVNYVSVYDAMRFINWLHNGQPTGAQVQGITETGAYTFTGATSVGTRNPGANVFLTSEDEWYKAAYYDADAGLYYGYPAGSNAATTCTDAPGNSLNSANCYAGVIDSSIVGSFPRASSPYGTYDQGGNLWEFIEATGSLSGGLPSLVARGGAYIHAASYLAASSHQTFNGGGSYAWGFRIAKAGSDVWRPANYERFDTSVPANNGTALANALANPNIRSIYLRNGSYILPGSVTINRTTPLFVHCQDRLWTSIEPTAANRNQPLLIVQNAPLVNIAGCRLRYPNTGLVGQVQNAQAIVAQNSASTRVEVQDCLVDSSGLTFAGPGTYRVQNCQLGGGGFVRSAITIDHPDADLMVFGGDITNGTNPRAVGVDENYHHIWQKRGRLRIYSTTVEGSLGYADFRIETASALGPHVLGNVRSEGANGDRNETGSASRLVYVPPGSGAVDVVVKNSIGAWLTGPGRLYDSSWNHATSSSVSPTADTITMNAHPFRTGEGPVRVTSASTSPYGLSKTTDYYVRKVDNNTVTLHLTKAQAQNNLAPVNLNSSHPNPVTLTSAYIKVISTQAYTDGQGPIRLQSHATLPSGLATNTDYYIAVIAPGPGDPPTIAIASTSLGSNGPLHPITSVGSSSSPHEIMVNQSGTYVQMPVNCSFVSYNGTGRLWLLGDHVHEFCGRHLVEGNAPGAQIISIGNSLGAPDPFSTLTGALPVISGVDAYYSWWWNPIPSNEIPFVRWIPNGAAPPKLGSSTPIPIDDVIPPSIPRPRLTAALPGMIDVKAAYNAAGDGDTDDTNAIQTALDVNCSSSNPINTPPNAVYLPAGTYKISSTLRFNSHLTTCNFGYGGWIAGAGSAVTTIRMADGLKEGVFTTDGFALGTVQGLGFKTWTWQANDPQKANFDIEAFGDGQGPFRDLLASQQDSLYDVHFDGGWAAFATGVVPPTVGNCSSIAVFGGMFENAAIGFNSGHYNAIANVVHDSIFQDNDYPIGSWTVDTAYLNLYPQPDGTTPSYMPSGGSYAAFRSTSRGGSPNDFRGGGGNGGYYFYEWDTDSSCYIVGGSSGNHTIWMYERSYIDPPAVVDCPAYQGDPTASYPFSVGGAGGPTFLYSTLTNHPVQVGQGAILGQSYAAKLASYIPDWLVSGTTENSPWGQLEELP